MSRSFVEPATPNQFRYGTQLRVFGYNWDATIFTNRGVWRKEFLGAFTAISHDSGQCNQPETSRNDRLCCPECGLKARSLSLHDVRPG
jgi:hypothetical protein